MSKIWICVDLCSNSEHFFNDILDFNVNDVNHPPVFVIHKLSQDRFHSVVAEIFILIISLDACQFLFLRKYKT